MIGYTEEQVKAILVAGFELDGTRFATKNIVSMDYSNHYGINPDYDDYVDITKYSETSYGIVHWKIICADDHVPEREANADSFEDALAKAIGMNQDAAQHLMKLEEDYQANQKKVI